MPARFHCYVAEDGWRWRLLGSNNRVLARAVSAFRSASAAMREAAAVAVLATHAPIDVVGDSRAWRWALVDGSKLRAVAGHDYKRRGDCQRAAAGFRAAAARAELPTPEEAPGHNQWHVTAQPGDPGTR